MKKFSVVLLVALLAVSGVFAALTGYVQAKYQINFDKGTFGYKNPASKDDLEAKLSFDSLNAAKKGEGKAYIDAAASFNFTAEGISDGDRYGLSRLGYFQLSVDKLTIVGEDWTWNLLEAEEVGGYADSTLDFHTWYRGDKFKGDGVADGEFEDPRDAGKPDAKKYTVTEKDNYAKYAKKVAYGVSYGFYDGDDDFFGTTFKKGGYTVALAANGHVGEYAEDAAQQFYFGVESKEFELGDVTAQAAFGFSYNNTQENQNEYEKDGELWENNDLWEIGASFKAAYATDAFSVSIATDQTIETQGHHTVKKEGSVTPTYNGDVLAQATVGPVSADVFFAKEAKSKKGDDAGYKWQYNILDFEDFDGEPTLDDLNDRTGKYFKKADNKKYFSSQKLYKQNTVENLFSFQVAVDLSEFDVPVAFKFQALNMVNDQKIFNVFADVALGDLTLNVYGKDLLASYNKIYGKDKKAYYSAGDGSYYYWDENGAKQKLGVDASYVVNEALSVNAGFFAQLGARKIGANVGATYVADLFTADASLAAEFLCFDKTEKAEMGKTYEAKEYNKMQLKVSVTSDKIVDGAELKIKYETGNLFNNLEGEYDYYVGQQAGVLTTTCKVTF